MPPAVKGVNSAIPATILDRLQRRKEPGGRNWASNHPSRKRCLFLEQMLAIWATQSARAGETAVTGSHQRKSVPRHKMQPVTARSTAGSRTRPAAAKSQRAPRAARYKGARKSHLGSGGRLAPPRRRPACLFRGPLRRRALGPERVFPKRPGLGHLGCRPGGVGCRVRGSWGRQREAVPPSPRK